MKNYLVTIYGIFHSFTEASNHIATVKAGTLSKRLKNGIEIDVACTVPPTGRVSLEFINLEGKGYYKISGTEELFTCRQIIEYYRPDLLSEYDKLHPDGTYVPYEKA